MPTATPPTSTPGTPLPELHATPARKDLVYDMRAEQAALPIVIRRPDGTTMSTLLVLDGDEMLRVSIQLDQAIERRRAAGHAMPLYAD